VTFASLKVLPSPTQHEEGSKGRSRPQEGDEGNEGKEGISELALE
jgi:hypothetical protein